MMEKNIDNLVDLFEKCEKYSLPNLDQLLSILFPSLEERNLTLLVVCKLVHIELGRVKENKSELFRGTTVATKLFKLFSDRNGLDYIKAMLKGTMENIFSLNIEIDISPDNKTEEDLEKNLELLYKQTEIIFSCIINSIDIFPSSIKEYLYLVAESIKSKDNDEDFIVQCIGNIFILRFICPSILIPARCGIPEGESPKIRKSITNSAKIIQKLANGTVFDNKKEQDLIYFNRFILENMQKYKNFIKSIYQEKVIEKSIPISESDRKPLNLTSEQILFLKKMILELKKQRTT